ncbi:MAG TPA: acetoacetate--CoA ligase [Myxococcota bacterium]|nr:acetoacetate--CoA ligase [Myxococcota bacterium]
MSERPLWQPSPEQVETASLTAFMRRAEAQSGAPLRDYASLHRWSVESPERFWPLVWSFCNVVGDGPGPVRGARWGEMPGTRWFPEARLNFAENLLRRRDAAPALLFRGEHGAERSVSWSALGDAVARFAASLRAAGVAPGDRVAAVLPNAPETVVAALGAASVGAIWSSCSPDFGASGVLDRFGQIAPKWLLVTDGYVYGGKRFDVREKAEEVLAGLPSVERCVGVPYLEERPALPARMQPWQALHERHAGATHAFARLPFDHPLYILFSSGTTGAPKCIVHGAGGTLLQHLKEHRLHVDLRPGDRFFYFTTCGWMMWNWLVSGLASDATLCLYDGSPMHPDAMALFRWTGRSRVAVFGASAKFYDGVAKAGAEPARDADLGGVRTLLSTGSPLAPESFDFLHRKVAPHAQLASISGGTDIVSCFVLGCPLLPVWRGEIQARGLGMAVDVFDEDGRPVRGQKGELVCTAPFPSMPLCFWNDPDGSRYRAAYFERFPGIWCHGDFAEITPHDGIVIHGRSDAVLNPGGVRIGTAEIYRQVEQEEQVIESLAIAQEWQGDVRVVLFVRLREGAALDETLRTRIAQRIRANATPRHVPARIVQVADIPRTRSGKIVELAVREVVHGRPVKNREALANPEALAHFAGLEELAR